MHIITDVNKIWNTVQRNLSFILNVLSESSIHFYLAFNSSCSKECWLFQIKWFLSKMRLPYCAYLCRNAQGHMQIQSSVQLFDMAFAIKSLVFVVHFLNAFWPGNETFPKGSSWYEFDFLLVVFHLLYGKYKDEKICYYPCRSQNQKFSFVSHSCHSCSTRVALVSHSCR